MAATASIFPAELAQLRAAGRKIELIDVRTPEEFREAHVEFARNVPLDQLDPVALARGRANSAGDALYFICRSGGRSLRACELVRAAGFAAVVNVDDGTLGWIEAGLPVVGGE